MLEEIMDYLNNHFEIRGDDMKLVTYCGEYTIENGCITLPFMKEGQYFRVKGSTLNDGVYAYPCADLDDETFTGMIFPLAVPKKFIALVCEIEKWQQENGSKVIAPFNSESFAGYSYTKASGTDGNFAWKDAFGSRLKIWSKRL